MVYWPELTRPRNAIGKMLSDHSLLIPKKKKKIPLKNDYLFVFSKILIFEIHVITIFTKRDLENFKCLLNK